MADDKKEIKKPLYSVGQFASDIVEEFDRIISRHAFKSNGKHYDGILLYTTEDSKFSEILKDLVLMELKFRGLEQFTHSTNSIEKYNFSSNGLNYYSVDVDWFVKEGWIKSPNFSLVGNPY